MKAVCWLDPIDAIMAERGWGCVVGTHLASTRLLHMGTGGVYGEGKDGRIRKENTFKVWQHRHDLLIWWFLIGLVDNHSQLIRKRGGGGRIVNKWVI